MNESLLVRPTIAADVAAIARIAEATGLFPGVMLGAMMAGYLDGSKADIWLTAATGGDAIGFGFCEPERMTVGTWNLLALGVTPHRQGRGVGAALVAAVEDRLRDEAQRVLLVETIGSPAFSRTRAFYRREGFVEEARIRAFYDEGLDKVVFWKRL